MHSRILPVPLSICAAALLLLGCASSSPTPPAPGASAPADSTSGYGAVPPSKAPAYVFAWPFLDSLKATGMQPRGGTTRGQAVTLDIVASDAWNRLRAPGLSQKERDRAAILAMAGDYRASFDFLETVVFPAPGDSAPGRTAARPARPYRSWGTERIYVVADSTDFVSLQHVMVMFFQGEGEDDSGKVQGPMVMKHWRQDWRYEPAFVSEFRGHGTWLRRDLEAAERKGAWSQSVYHVDDSPRYASVGRWNHNASFSVWTGAATRRPLPRREHTVRKDYHAIEGVNRHVVLPTGWVHEQDNLKLVLDSAGHPDSKAPYRAREAGVDRYDRVKGFDFSAGDAYWSKTGEFWRGVRERWDRILSSREPVRVAEDCEGEPAFFAFFGMAEGAETAGPGEKKRAARLDSLFSCILSGKPR
jgi:hypothetical protein